MKTVPEIVAEIEAYRPVLVSGIREMAAERGSDPDLLNAARYIDLLTEEAEWSDAFAAKRAQANDPEEEKVHRDHAAAVRAIIARVS